MWWKRSCWEHLCRWNSQTSWGGDLTRSVALVPGDVKPKHQEDKGQSVLFTAVSLCGTLRSGSVNTCERINEQERHHSQRPARLPCGQVRPILQRHQATEEGPEPARQSRWPTSPLLAGAQGISREAETAHCHFQGPSLFPFSRVMDLAFA